jgi:hypothetical protein
MIFWFCCTLIAYFLFAAFYLFNAHRVIMQRKEILYAIPVGTVLIIIMLLCAIMAIVV